MSHSSQIANAIANANANADGVATDSLQIKQMYLLLNSIKKYSPSHLD